MSTQERLKKKRAKPFLVRPTMRDKYSSSARCNSGIADPPARFSSNFFPRPNTQKKGEKHEFLVIGLQEHTSILCHKNDLITKRSYSIHKIFRN